MIVNGLVTEAVFHNDADLFRPFLTKIKEENIRTIFLAAMPGTGKSTLAVHLEELAEDMGISLQALQMDGFHFTNSQLEQMGLQDRKGSPETFDREKLETAIKERKKWPIYSRIRHDPDGEMEVTAKTILVEGNYLLLDEPGWRDLSRLADLTIFLEGEEDALLNRLIQRKQRGGKTKEEAETWVNRSDRNNLKRVKEHRIKPDILWIQDRDWNIRQIPVK